ncbi:MAG: hypothetical protein C0398_00935 [Coprothermobacter sp.]|jgi:2-dehydropantoate 2-reductase|nr:hypothetical protein [Coprothermobacter sp.]
MTKKIAVVGVGGRTGTLFAYEMRNSAQILGVARHAQLEDIKQGNILVARQGSMPTRFESDIVEEQAFSGEAAPDFIFLTVKNPVAPSVRYYYERIQQEKPPDLVLSQNGVVAAEEARTELERIFGSNAQRIRIIRVSLFNPISMERIEGNSVISYFLPIRLAFGVAFGPDEIQDLRGIFLESGFEAEEVPSKNVKNMEFSKLFTNLLGVPSSSHGLSIEEGFADKKVFEEEIESLREYARTVKKGGGRFLNLHHYPTRLYALLLGCVPVPVLSLFRKQIAKAITKGRGSKEKGNIDEIDYYSGAVVGMGERLGVETPVNRKIYQTMKART